MVFISRIGNWGDSLYHHPLLKFVFIVPMRSQRDHKSWLLSIHSPGGKEASTRDFLAKGSAQFSESRSAVRMGKAWGHMMHLPCKV